MDYADADFSAMMLEAAETGTYPSDMFMYKLEKSDRGYRISKDGPIHWENTFT